jgi:carboxypeptidase T
MIKFLQSTFFFLLLISLTNAQDYKQVKIYLEKPSQVSQLFEAGMQFDHFTTTKDHAIITFIDENDYQVLQTSGFTFDVLIDNWKEYYNQRHQLTEEEKQQFIQQSEQQYSVSGFGFGSMGGFYTLAEVGAQLDSMFANYPNLITQKVSLGNSIEGRPIWMVKISDNPNVNESEPQVLYTALIHAREPESMEQMIYFMYYLLENYGTDPEATYLVNNRELYFVPVINPDGYEYNHMMAPNGGYMWRKNKRDNNGNGTFQESYDGVDLNRNYGPHAYWNAPNGGSSTDPSSETYRGTIEFSEPETQAIRDFLATKNFNNALNYHTYGNYLIFPYGALSHETADSLTFREFASDMTGYNGYTYGTDLQTVGYSTRGNSDDYYYDGDVIATNGNILAMTPEVGATGFWPSQSEIFPLAQENLRPNLYYAWVGGEYVSLENANFTQPYFNPGDEVSFLPSFKNKGLADGSNIHVDLNSLSGFATITNGSAVISSIAARSSVTLSTPFSFTIASNTPAEEVIGLQFVISDGTTVMRIDTLNIIVGTPEVIWTDTTGDPGSLWTITKTPSNSQQWEATNLTYYTPPVSFTESKIGNYVDNATVTMTLTSAIDLSGYSNPRLVFWTKYDIESNWDYGQVSVSTNNGSSWTPLEGEYTEPGVGSFQPNGQPLYDGARLNWVREEMPLSGHTSPNVKFRFQLRSDGNVTRDGWYLDDIGVIVYTIVPVELTSFAATQNNENVSVTWSTATEVNNRGFEIQRSNSTNNSRERNWETIGYLDGAGTSTESHFYSFTDHSPINGKSFYRLKQIDFDGTTKFYTEAEVSFILVKDFALEQNYPNPFNPNTSITYSIPVSGYVNLTVYNLLGSEVAVLVDGYVEAGIHSVEFSSDKVGKNIGSGIYIYTMKSGSFVQTRKMVLLK